MHKSNYDIKAVASSKDVKMWQIADKYGVSEYTFCRKLRKPLSDIDHERIITIIDEIAHEEV